MMHIIWSDQAKANVQEIFDYYRIVASVKVAKSIKNKIIKKPLILVKQPEMGQAEENPIVENRDFRYLIEGNYKIVYKIYKGNKEILIAAVFDTRQNPSSLKV